MQRNDTFYQILIWLDLHSFETHLWCVNSNLGACLNTLFGSFVKLSNAAESKDTSWIQPHIIRSCVHITFVGTTTKQPSNITKSWSVILGYRKTIFPQNGTYLAMFPSASFFVWRVEGLSLNKNCFNKRLLTIHIKRYIYMYLLPYGWMDLYSTATNNIGHKYNCIEPVPIILVVIVYNTIEFEQWAGT